MAVTASFAGGVLTVTSDSASDVIVISRTLAGDIPEWPVSPGREAGVVKIT